MLTTTRASAAATFISLAMLLIAQPAPAADSPPAAEGGFSAGLSVKPLHSAAEIGLPVYPGAVPQRDKDDDSAGGSVGLWGGPFGMQLHAIKLHSRDPVDTVATFYREALARQGPGAVLDCSQPRPDEAAKPKDAEKDKDKDKKILRCGSDKPAAGGYLFKIGTASRIRIVGLEPQAGGTRIRLVRVDLRGE
jgi:hypothetical protein